MLLTLPRRSGRSAALAAALAMSAGLVWPGAASAAPATGLSCPSTTCRQVTADLGAPFGVAVDGHGSAFVTAYDGALRQVDLADGTVRVVADGLGNLRRVATDGNGTVYAAEWSGHVVTVDAAAGAHRVLADGLGSAVIAVAYHEGHVYAGTNAGAVWDLVAGRPPRKVADDLFGITDLATAPDGRLWVTSFMGTVARLDPATGSRADFGGRELYEPVAVEVGPDAAAWFVVGAAELHRIDLATGTSPTAAKFGGTAAFDLAYEPGGETIVLSSGSALTSRLWAIRDLIS